jgi:hypothetical protein
MCAQLYNKSSKTTQGNTPTAGQGNSNVRILLKIGYCGTRHSALQQSFVNDFIGFAIKAHLDTAVKTIRMTHDDEKRVSHRGHTKWGRSPPNIDPDDSAQACTADVLHSLWACVLPSHFLGAVTPTEALTCTRKL